MNSVRPSMQGVVCRIAIAGMLLVILCGLPLTSFGAAGDLDPTFGGTGIIVGALNSHATGVLELSDGKILVTSGAETAYVLTLTRYNPDGSLDTTFNGTGQVSTSFGKALSNRNIAVLSDGRIIVAGWVAASFGRADFGVVRYNPDGTLDTLFNGTGKVQTDIEGGDDAPTAMAVQDDGKVLLSGYSNGNAGLRGVLLRYNSDGSLDTSFNGTGKIILPESENVFGNSLTIQKDGKIVMIGSASDYVNLMFTLRRYNSDGTPDTSLNGSGIVNTVFPGYHAAAFSGVIQSDGRIIAAGHVTPVDGPPAAEFALVRYLPNGQLDTSFNGTGKIVTPVTSGNDSCTSVALQRDGRIVAVGDTHTTVNSAIQSDVVLVRYDVDGALDTTFGDNGVRIVDLGDAIDYASDVTVQTDQKIVVTASRGTDFTRRSAVLRFEGLATAANSKSVTTNEDTPKAITLSGTGLQTPLKYIVLTQPQFGTLSGTAPDLIYTPLPDYNGSDSFTFKVNDGNVDSNIATISITVSAANDAPTLNALSNADIFEDAEPQTVSLSGITTGALNEVQNLTITATSNNPALIPAPTVSYSSLSDSGSLSFKTQPNANGTATITVTVNDGQASNQTVTRTFTVKVASVNDAPSFLKGANQTVVEDSGSKTVNGWATQVSIGPVNETGQTREFIVSNDNQALFSVPPAVNASGALTFTPNPDAHGSATVTVQLRDSGGTANGGVNTSAPQSFVINVLPSNDVPYFTKGADQILLEDTTLVVPGWATQVGAGPLDEIGQELAFVVSTDNPSLFASTPEITSAGTLVIKPSANTYGNALVRIKLRDNGGTANGGVDTSVEQTFNVSINGVNDAPSFVEGIDVAVLENSGERVVSGWATGIQKGPADEGGQSIEFIVTNDNPVLFAVAPKITTDGTLRFTPAENANGSARVSVQLTDNGGTANGGVDSSLVKGFRIDVLSVNNAPSFAGGGSITVAQDAGPQTFTNWASQISAGPSNESEQTLHFTVTVERPELFSQQPAISSSGSLTFTPAAEASGTANVQVVLHDNGGTQNGGVETSNSYSFKIAVTTYAEELGVYYGLVTSVPGTPQTHDRSGLIKLAVKRGGAFSGSLRLAGKTYPLRGAFDKGGLAQFAKTGATELVLVRKNRPPLTLSLQLDVGGETGSITGTLKEEGVLFAVVEAPRMLYTARPNSAPPNRIVPTELLGKYTIAFAIDEPEKDAGTFPQGDGIGTLTVRSSGVAVLSGTLADGTPISFSSPISENNEWPVYVEVGRKRGAISGWVRFQDISGVSDLAGVLHWFKPGSLNANFYPEGWSNGLRTHLVGSKFEEAKSAPGLTLPGLEPVSSFGNARLEFTGGGLQPHRLIQVLNIDIYNRISYVAPELSNLQLKIGKNGYFTGKVTVETKQPTVRFKGVILQKQKLGSGFFMGKSEIGAVMLKPRSSE